MRWVWVGLVGLFKSWPRKPWLQCQLFRLSPSCRCATHSSSRALRAQNWLQTLGLHCLATVHTDWAMACTYFMYVLAFPSGNTYGCFFLKTCPTRLQGMISRLPPHIQTRKEISARHSQFSHYLPVFQYLLYSTGSGASQASKTNSYS